MYINPWTSACIHATLQIVSPTMAEVIYACYEENLATCESEIGRKKRIDDLHIIKMVEVEQWRP